MKTLVQDYESGRVRLENVPLPAAKPGGIVVRTMASVVSAGTERQTIEFARMSLAGKALSRPDLVRTLVDKVRLDGLAAALHAAKGRLESWLPLGYSSAGIVLAIGPNVKGFRVGDRVACAGQGHASHAETVWVPQQFAATIPDNVSIDDAAFATLGAIALHGVHQSHVGPGDTVAVIGLGLLGTLTTQILLAYGCRVLGLDIRPEATERARALGADVGDPTDPRLADLVDRLTNGHGLDKAIITASTSSNEPIHTAATIVRRSGRVCVVGLVGMDVDRRAFYDKEIELVVAKSYGPGRDDPAYPTAPHDLAPHQSRWSVARNLAEYLRLVANGAIRTEELVSRRIEFDQAPAAYEDLLGSGTGTLLIEYKAQAPSEPSTAPVRIAGAPGRPALGLLGAGSFALSVLLPALQSSGRPHDLVAVVSPTGVKAAEAAGRFGFDRAASDATSVIGAADINAVIIATRHDTHAELAKRALASGQSVFVEKPLALDDISLKAVFDAAQTSPGLLQVGHNRRFAPLVRHMRDLVASRVVAPLQLHYLVNAGPLPADHWVRDPRQGGGRILSEACHFIDTLHFIVGHPPVRVFASGGSGNIRADDHVQILLEFADGSRGTISYTADGPKRLAKERLEATGAGLHLVLDNHRRLRIVRDRGTKTIRARGQDKGHRDQMLAFLHAVETGGPAPVPYDELYATCRATLAVNESLQTERPIDIPSLF